LDVMADLLMEHLPILLTLAFIQIKYILIFQVLKNKIKLSVNNLKARQNGKLVDL